MEEYIFYKKNKGDKMWWVEHIDYIGEMLVSLDKKRILNIFADYPHNFTREEKEIFDKENSYWLDIVGGGE